MDPKIDITITGNKKVQDFSRIETFSTLKGKVEEDIDIIASDGFQDVIEFPTNKIGTLSKIIVESVDCILRIRIAGVDTDLHITGYFQYDVNPDFVLQIQKVSVSTNSTEEVAISVRIWGSE